MLIINLEHFRQSIKLVVDMDYEYTFKNGTFWKEKYGEMNVNTAKVCLMIINVLAFFVLFAMVALMFSLFDRGLEWGKR